MKYFVTLTGDDAAGDGSTTKPWKSLFTAASKVAPNQGHVIQLGPGTFVERGLVEIPLGVSVIGQGKTLTTIKAAPSFYYHPTDPGYTTDKFLLSLSAFNQQNGNQSLRNFTIDGDSKQLHGGIYVRYRNNVTIDSVKVQNTNFTGIWFWDVKYSSLRKVELQNCSWGSTAWVAGALNLGNVENVDVEIDVDESTGYGIKAIGPSGYNNIFGLRIHNSRLSVNPSGLWSNGSAPNIACELWSCNLVGCEITNCYLDNTLSLVNNNGIPSTGIQTIHVHDNTFNMDARANGAGYAIECSVNDVEIDNNYIIKGSYGIANWANSMKNWNIHHNTFFALGGQYPGEPLRSQGQGLHFVKFQNNTIIFTGTKTMNVIGCYGGVSENIEVRNNLIIDANTSYSFWPNEFIHLENGATVVGSVVENNLFSKLPIGVVPIGGQYTNNQTIKP